MLNIAARRMLPTSLARTLILALVGLILLALASAAGASLDVGGHRVPMPFGLGVLTLVEAAKASTNMLQRGVIETFIDESPVLSRIPFMDIEGNAYQYSREASLPGVAFRAVNAGYTESTGTINNYTEGLKIYGGEADVDRFIERTMSNLQSQRALQLRLKTKAQAVKFTETFFEGDSGAVPESFDGLRTRLTGAQVILAGAGGATLTLAMIDDLIDAVPGIQVIYINDRLIRKVNDLVRATGQTTPEPRTEFGRRVYQYAGIDMVNPGLGLDGTTRVLGFDEDPGDGTSDTASIYGVRFGAQEFVSGLQNGGVIVDDLGLLETKPSYRHRIEWYVGLAVFSGKAAARLRGVTNT
jgi:hypothetical protein